MTHAEAISDQCHEWVRQLALPLIPERRVKGALAHVARESGLSFSKVRRIFYKQTDHILAYERERLRLARARCADSQIKQAEEHLAELRRIRSERHDLEAQDALPLAQ